MPPCLRVGVLGDIGTHCINSWPIESSARSVNRGGFPYSSSTPRQQVAVPFGQPTSTALIDSLQKSIVRLFPTYARWMDDRVTKTTTTTMTRSPVAPVPLLLLLLLAVGWLSGAADACSCQLEHPQHYYCSAHYVITARIRGVRSDEYNNYYRVKVNKVFKATEKASLLLQNKEIFSASQEIQCGVKLVKGNTYLLTGRVVDDKLRLTICDFYSEWSALTVKQKKGFKLLYEKGCSCKIVTCPWWNRDNCGSTIASQCAWETVNERNFDCQAHESVCMRQGHGLCGWNKSTKFKHCLKLRKESKERQRAREP